MDPSFEGEVSRVPPARWDTARLDLDDPLAPLKARSAEIARVVRRTSYIELLELHPEYNEIEESDFAVMNHDSETHYQLATQDCDIIVGQLKDNPETKLSPEQHKLVTVVLHLAPNAKEAKIMAAYNARARYMRVLNLAVAFETSLRELPRALQAAAAPPDGGEPLTDEYVADAIQAYEDMLAAEATDGDDNYHDYDWDEDETAEAAAIRAAEELLGYREPRRRYFAPVSFEVAQLSRLTIGQLSVRQDAEETRVLDLLEFLPPLREIGAILANQKGPEMREDTAIALLDAMELYLVWCIDKLDSAGTLDPLNKRFVRKMLGLPRNTPNEKIYEVYHVRTEYMDYLNARMSAHYGPTGIYKSNASPNPPAESAPISESDVEPAIREAENIFARARKALGAQAASEALQVAGEVTSDSRRVQRSHMAPAVRAAVRQALEQYWVGFDEDDDDNDGDILVPA